MDKRTYTRRTEDQIIGEIEARIAKIQTRMESKKRPDSPVLKELPKVKRNMARFSQLCMDHDRNDLSNTVQAFLATLEQQARQTSVPRTA